MTVSRGIGRGGVRNGAGRKENPAKKVFEIKPVPASGLTAEQLAKQHLDTVIASLVHTATAGESEGARVTAAKALADIARGPVGRAHVGKRDQQQADAETAGHNSEWGNDLDFEAGKPN